MRNSIQEINDASRLIHSHRRGYKTLNNHYFHLQSISSLFVMDLIITP